MQARALPTTTLFCLRLGRRRLRRIIRLHRQLQALRPCQRPTTRLPPTLKCHTTPPMRRQSSRPLAPSLLLAIPAIQPVPPLWPPCQPLPTRPASASASLPLVSSALWPLSSKRPLLKPFERKSNTNSTYAEDSFSGCLLETKIVILREKLIMAAPTLPRVPFCDKTRSQLFGEEITRSVPRGYNDISSPNSLQPSILRKQTTPLFRRIEKLASL
jgi:hypothetical protein